MVQFLGSTSSLSLNAAAITLTLPVASAFVVTGPGTVATGQTVQYTATLYYPDGSTVVPPYPTWGTNGHLNFIAASNPSTVQGQSPGSTWMQAAILYGGVVYQSNYLSITVT